MSKVSISNETFTGPFVKVDKRHLTVYKTLELIDDDNGFDKRSAKASIDV